MCCEFVTPVFQITSIVTVSPAAMVMPSPLNTRLRFVFVTGAKSVDAVVDTTDPLRPSPTLIPLTREKAPTLSNPRSENPLIFTSVVASAVIVKDEAYSVLLNVMPGPRSTNKNPLVIAIVPSSMDPVPGAVVDVGKFVKTELTVNPVPDKVALRLAPSSNLNPNSLESTCCANDVKVAPKDREATANSLFILIIISYIVNLGSISMSD